MQSSESEELFRLVNRRGASVTLGNRGARIVSVGVPDRRGNVAEIVDLCKPGDASWRGRMSGQDSVQFVGPTGAEVNYVWRDDNTLEVYLSRMARAELPAVFFNLNGHGCRGSHTLYLNATAARAGVFDIAEWQEGVMNEAAVLASADAGRQLNIYTTLPTVRVLPEALAAALVPKQPFPIREVEAIAVTPMVEGDNRELVFYEFGVF